MRRSASSSIASKESGRPGPSSVPKQKESALQCAYRLLGYRGRSEKELLGRLRMKGFDGSVVDETISRLKSAGFLDDRRLAASLVRYAGESKHLSVAGTKRFLAERGVPRDIIEETVKELDEMEAAGRLVEKKIAAMGKSGGEQRSDMIVKRLYGLLHRRGYPHETIRKVLEQFRYREDMK